MTDVRVGTGLDVHPFADEPRPLVLAGVTVPDAPGLAGHSDADVVAHAVTDALLGALALGDLGSRFGVDTPELAGADSLAFVRTAVADLAERGWRVGNVDAVVVAQRPRLGAHRDAMRAVPGRGAGRGPGRRVDHGHHDRPPRRDRAGRGHRLLGHHAGGPRMSATGRRRPSWASAAARSASCAPS